MKSRVCGFTLLEAMVALAVAATLLAIAVPAYSAAVAEANSMDAKAAMTSTLHDALAHSTMTNTDVVICPSPDGSLCRAGTDWTGGWIAYADLDGDRQHSARETTVHSHGPLGGGVRMRSTSGRTRLIYQPGGSNAGSNVTFTLCDRRGVRAARTLVLANDGDLRLGTATPAAAAQCVYGSG